jgi:membrane-associated phospholipid phosphatase
MLDIIKNNKFYFQLYFIFFFLLFFYVIKSEPLEATLYFGMHRSTFANSFFKCTTLLGEIYPFIGFTILYLWKNQSVTARKIAISGLLILLITSILKEFFAMDRPAVFIDNLNQLNNFKYVDGIEILRGATSFPSGHTAAAFVVWSLFAFQLKEVKYQILCLIIAILVGISRVYLTQHFPQDVLLGSFIGISSAILIEYFIEKWEENKVVRVIASEAKQSVKN